MYPLNPLRVASTFVCYALGGLFLSAVMAVCLGYGALFVVQKNEALAGPAFAVGAGVGVLFGVWTAGKYFFDRLDDLRRGMP